jgi:hypothetical protein
MAALMPCVSASARAQLKKQSTRLCERLGEVNCGNQSDQNKAGARGIRRPFRSLIPA